MIVTEQNVSAALGKIHSAPQLLKGAKYRAEKAGHMLKHIWALEMKASGEKTVSAQEREAYASAAYLKAIEEDALATAELAKVNSEIEAAKMTIDIWRTESASERAALANYT